MKRLILALVLAAIVFLVWNRQRVFVRDPLASVTRDGADVNGEQVYINFFNDVLLENDNQPRHIMIVQNGQPIGVPTHLGCLHWVACLTDADAATTETLGGSIDSMSGKTVEFQDPKKRHWIVTLH